MKGFKTGQNLSTLLPQPTGPLKGGIANERAVATGTLGVQVIVTWDDGVVLSRELVDKAGRAIAESYAAAFMELENRLAAQP